MRTTENKPPGLLDAADIALIKERYELEIDQSDVVQYKLCQIIIHLENQLKDRTGE